MAVQSFDLTRISIRAVKSSAETEGMAIVPRGSGGPPCGTCRPI